MSARTRVWAGLACLLVVCRCATAQVEVLPYLDDSTIHQVNLTVATGDWASLLQNYEANTYYQASVTWDGFVVGAGIRQHGVAGRSPIKPNVDVNFGHYQKDQNFLGLPFIVLKANNEDPSNLCEWFTMKFFRMMGFPSSREAPAQVYVNGQYFGFYTIVEHIDSTFLQRNLGEDGGYLYEWKRNFNSSYGFDNLGTDPSAYAGYLDLKSNQAAPDLQTFCNLVQVINQASSSTFTDADFIAALSQYIDPKAFLTYAATENVMAEADGLVGGIVGMDNFYLYQLEGTTFYQLIPWDEQLSFSAWNRDLMTGFTLDPGINLLAQRLVAIPEYQNFYLGQVAKAASLLGASGGWGFSTLSAQYTLIQPAAVNDPNKQCMVNGALQGCGAADFQSTAEWMLNTFLPDRAPFVEQQLSTYGYQPVTGDPAISNVTVAGQTPASAAGALVAPGALVDVSGANLGPAAQASASPLPRALGSTFVSVEGVRAPLVMTSSGQIQIQIPWDLAAGAVHIAVSVGGEMSNTWTATLAPAAPTILAVTHAATGDLVTAAAPAVPGEILTVYTGGLGAVNADLALGSAIPAGFPVTTVATPQLAFGTAALAVLYSGLAPDYVGLYQVNTQLPLVLPPTGSQTLTITCAGQSAGVAVPVAGQ